MSYSHNSEQKQAWSITMRSLTRGQRGRGYDVLRTSQLQLVAKGGKEALMSVASILC